ncbi:hypothetical protein IAQ61_010103 [Plenodomus lingam]|uniref:ABM domain-containing protein n=1 Tax=Leptosphaeria maculans (strain JN3 / isolate v23.1.3 / race Av1-4-5-6-7-8) TaxID=985895 RepID=E5A2Y4_LEPMJ|nr:hypothetical protein LEMA_P094060.1 [Plenodomus lingam JN3]KAH9861902.1 hypothetical protein IAQ61_010103 [Plenodomus lingam]CBX97997.1 hypothetical protein LEMA_P094060.1 [Plenodomus lingam JN3]
MAERTIEVVYIPIKAGVNLEAGEAKEVWNNTIATIAKQPGLNAFYWGFQVEHPDVVQMVIEWESIAAHEAFMATPEYNPFLEKMQTHVQAESPIQYHILLRPARNPTDPFSMPVTECLRIWIPASYPSPTYESQFMAFEDAAAALPGMQAKGLVAGWQVEPATHESLGEGVVGKCFTSFMGWPSLEAHEQFRNIDGFEQVVGTMAEGMKGMDLVHVRFMKVK